VRALIGCWHEQLERINLLLQRRIAHFVYDFFQSSDWHSNSAREVYHQTKQLFSDRNLLQGSARD
jgi:hypothetical protein